MLINCPECTHECSDKAFSCPSCGFPFKQNITASASRSNRKKRLPNGFGQISELKNQNLRKRFRAMVTVGKDATGRPIVKLLKPQAYFETYNEAYEALLNFNKDPYSLEKTMTLREIYEKWSVRHFAENPKRGTKSKIKMAWDYCEPMYDTPIEQIKPSNIRTLIESAFVIRNGKRKEATNVVKQEMKQILAQMFDYAMEYEIVSRNPARDLKISLPITIAKEHIHFTEDELNILWQNSDQLVVKVILIQCYSGWRPNELVNLKIENINLQTRMMVGGSKTQAGKDRTVPIHPLILPLVKHFYENASRENSEFLIPFSSYSRYHENFERCMKRLNINLDHRPHDCRVTFVTLAKKYNVDEYAIKRMVGHAISDITEKIYTKRSDEWLLSEIEKIRKV